MLPLHGQGTAAVEQKVTGQAGFLIVPRNDVFDKQAKPKFAEFLQSEK